jgi:hypothetical protein
LALPKDGKRCFGALLFAFFKTCSRSIACAERAAIAGARVKAVHRNSDGALECFQFYVGRALKLRLLFLTTP